MPADGGEIGAGNVLAAGGAAIKSRWKRGRVFGRSGNEGGSVGSGAVGADFPFMTLRARGRRGWALPEGAKGDGGG